MKRVEFNLRVMVPDEIDDPDVLTDITYVGDENETLDRNIVTFLYSYYLNDLERRISDELPDGWYARIEGGTINGKSC
jgi:hypothetical protein